AGHLLTLAAGLQMLPDHPIISANSFDGISATLRLLQEQGGMPGTRAQAAVEACWLALEGDSAVPGAVLPSLSQAAQHLGQLVYQADIIVAEFEGSDESEQLAWARRLQAD